MAIYPIKPFVDKGIQVGPELHSLNDPLDSGYVVEPGYKAFTLTNRARGRQTLTDGTEVASSLSVSNGGQYFTEVFSLPVPAGNFFYHRDDEVNETSTLLFNTAHPNLLPINVFYETRGNKIKAGLFNIYNYGKGIFDGGGLITLVHTYPTASLTDIIVIAQAADGSTVSYTVTPATKTVTLTGSAGVECSFMLIAIPA